jgi:hypothetical protein
MDFPDRPGAAQRPIVIDAEHFAVRFWVPAGALVFTVVVHFVAMAVVSRVLEDTSPLCVVLPLDALAFVGGILALDRAFKRWLPSRRSATLSQQVLVVTDRRRSPAQVSRIEWGRTVNVKAWRFVVRRRTRIPKGWFCLALHLLQDDDDTILYTFMSPQDAEQMAGYSHFTRLRPRQETLSGADLSTAAEQRRLLLLEDRRWEDGAEISADDFRAVLAMVRQHVPEWS